jgi:hypothetical protein
VRDEDLDIALEHALHVKWEAIGLCCGGMNVDGSTSKKFAAGFPGKVHDFTTQDETTTNQQHQISTSRTKPSQVDG